MAKRILRVGIVIYLMFIALGLLAAIALLDFHEYRLGVAGLFSVLSLTMAAAYRRLV